MTVPGNINALLLGGQRGYQIERSLRFNSADSAYLVNSSTRTTTVGAYTFSFWVKRCALGGLETIWSSDDAAGASNEFVTGLFSTDNKFYWYHYTGNDPDAAQSNGVLRDTAAWYHIVFSKPASAVGTLYINGVAQTKQTSYTADADAFSNAKYIGSRYNGTRYSNCYLTEFYGIDGQALTPSSFGETDTITGVWKPKKYSGSGYGTNGFYLKFADNSGTTSTTLGKDSSGNGNNFTPNNFSVTAGAGNDSMIDTPTPYADGGNGRGNYCTLNPVAFGNTGYTSTISDGNLQIYATTYSSNNTRTYAASFSTTSGKWYFETDLVTVSGVGNYLAVGWTSTSIGDATTTFGGTRALIGAMFGYSASTTTFKYNNSTASTTITGASSQGGDRGMIAVDFDAGKLWIGKNGSWWNASNTLTTFDLSSPTATFTPTGALFYPVVEPIGSGDNTNRSGAIFNFGQRSFSYTPPAGFLALNTQNLPEPSIKKPSSYMDVKLYTGNGTSQTISGLGFSPDLVIAKSRSTGTLFHNVMDSVRGSNKLLFTNSTVAEETNSNVFTALTSDGFSVGSDTSANKNSDAFVAWCWDESATPGFDIVTYTGNGAADRTVAHSLGVAPAFFIIKNRTTATDWPVYHKSLPSHDGGNYPTNSLRLNTTGALANTLGLWVAPTSTVITVSDAQLSAGNRPLVNTNGDNYVAYLWSEVAGFSKFGSYTGNGSTDGPFVFCGFRPRWVMFKCSSSTEAGNADWHIQDSSRNASNISTGSNRLFANLSAAESSNAEYKMDFLSNGFKLRTDGVNYGQNNNGNTYIFAAFSESPQKYSLAR